MTRWHPILVSTVLISTGIFIILLVCCRIINKACVYQGKQSACLATLHYEFSPIAYTLKDVSPIEAYLIEAGASNFELYSFKLEEQWCYQSNLFWVIYALIRIKPRLIPCSFISSLESVSHMKMTWRNKCLKLENFSSKHSASVVYSKLVHWWITTVCGNPSQAERIIRMSNFWKLFAELVSSLHRIVLRLYWVVRIGLSSSQMATPRWC